MYARRMGQPTQRATNYTARSNIDTAQIFLHANGQRRYTGSIHTSLRSPFTWPPKAHEIIYLLGKLASQCRIRFFETSLR